LGGSRRRAKLSYISTLSNRYLYYYGSNSHTHVWLAHLVLFCSVLVAASVLFGKAWITLSSFVLFIRRHGAFVLNNLAGTDCLALASRWVWIISRGGIIIDTLFDIQLLCSFCFASRCGWIVLKLLFLCIIYRRLRTRRDVEGRGILPLRV